MLDCLILGDSIAVGVGQARPACTVAARVGIGSGAYLRTMFPAVQKTADTAVISLGVNDSAGPDTLDNLRRLRVALQVRQVTWLLPGLKEDVRRAIQVVAAEHRDRLVDTRPQVGADHLHPTAAGYRLIAASAVGDATASGGAVVARLPVVFHPTVAINPPQFLPMLHVPPPHATLQDGGPFRRWLPTGFAVRAAPAMR